MTEEEDTKADPNLVGMNDHLADGESEIGQPWSEGVAAKDNIGSRNALNLFV